MVKCDNTLHDINVSGGNLRLKIYKSQDRQALFCTYAKMLNLT